MLIMFLACMLMASATTEEQAAPAKAGSSKKKSSAKKQDQSEADKIADAILADTKEANFVPKWYEEIYPALKRKYKEPVSRELYDTWRTRYYYDVVSLYLIGSEQESVKTHVFAVF